MKNTPQRIFALFTILSLSSCDPGLTGNLRVVNQSDSLLTVVVRRYEESDTINVVPGSNMIVHKLGGIGNKAGFDCCPCRLDTIIISTSAGVIKKNPFDSSNWVIPNKGKLRKFGGEEVHCEFYVTQSDL